MSLFDVAKITFYIRNVITSLVTVSYALNERIMSNNYGVWL